MIILATILFNMVFFYVMYSLGTLVLGCVAVGEICTAKRGTRIEKATSQLIYAFFWPTIECYRAIDRIGSTNG